ncbi:hypothetical protein QBC35DRAFT_42341 [Podospora australis]|uniref:IBR domain-containing protein n=1 Tax=Podospora australis TaxID=1536484 RepID=A0AAN6X2G3_9PEZI|nr:hypothetical protein QBC35DRAFT_42341 [Podospora australis]
MDSDAIVRVQSALDWANSPIFGHAELLGGLDFRGDFRLVTKIQHVLEPVSTDKKCTVCGDTAQISNACGSGHAWCCDCLQQTVLAATRNTTDPAVFPPRCCNPSSPLLPLQTVTKSHAPVTYLSDQDLEAYNQAALLVQQQRTTKQMYDKDVLMMTIVSPESGQFCPTCATLVSRTDGRNDMTCGVCGTDCCYLCGGKLYLNALATHCHDIYAPMNLHTIRWPAHYPDEMVALINDQLHKFSEKLGN